MSPRALGRTFSFDNDDESSLHANRSDKINPFGGMASPPAYTDSPARRTYSDSPPPPPAHTSSTAYQIPRPTIVQPPRPHIQVNTRKVQYGAYRSPDLDHSASNRTASTITPGADNLGERAVGGGIAGIAMGVAHTDEHGSGVEALRSPRESPQADRGLPPEPYNTIPNLHPHMRDPYASPAPSGDPFDDQRGSPTPSPGDITPRGNPSSHSIPMSEYPFRDVYGNGRSSFTDNPYQRFSTAWDPRVARGDIDPDDIEDDGDDFMEPPLRPRRSVLGLKNSPRNSVPEGAVVGAGGAAAATAGILGTLGSLVGKNNAVSSGTRDPSGQYGAVPGSSGSGFDNNGVEKSEWLSKQASGRKRLRWIMGISIALALIGGIVGGVIGGLLNNSSSSSSSSSDSTVAADDSALDLNSPAIKKLMNNAHLHRVFPAMDYTPFNAQYVFLFTFESYL